MNYKQWVKFNIDGEEALLILDTLEFGAMSPEVKKRKKHIIDLKEDYVR